MNEISTVYGFRSVVFTGKEFLYEMKNGWCRYLGAQRKFDSVCFNKVFVENSNVYGAVNNFVALFNTSDGPDFRYSGTFVSILGDYLVTKLAGQYIVYHTPTQKPVKYSEYKVFPILGTALFRYSSYDARYFGLENIAGDKLTKVKYESIFHGMGKFLQVFEGNRKLNYLIDSSGKEYVK